MTTSAQRQGPKRGEVWLVAYEPVGGTSGREQAGQRPALVISVDPFNETSGLVLAVPITRSRPATRLPLHMHISPPDSGLQYDSTILCGQVRCLARDRFLRRLGRVPDAYLDGVVPRLRSLIEP